MGVASPKNKSKRILSLDLLRGYFLLVILLDHLYFFPNGFDFLTGRGGLFTSAGEGFFIISGLVLGIVRGSKLINVPFKKVAGLLLKRSLILYLSLIITTILFVLLGWAFIHNPDTKYGLPDPSIGIFTNLIDIITIRTIYGWTDYLRLYALFLLITPIAMWLLRKRMWGVVLSISIFVWLLTPTPADAYTQPISWQALFFIPMIVGFHLEDLKKIWRKLNFKLKKTIKLTTLFVFWTTLIFNQIAVFVAPNFDGGIWDVINDIYLFLDPLFNKDQMMLPRLLLSFIWFASLWYIFHKNEKWIKKYTGWILKPFGENSLYTYIIQGFVVYILHLAVFIPDSYFNIDFTTPGYWSVIPYNLLISSIAIGLTLLAIKTKFLMKIIPR